VQPNPGHAALAALEKRFEQFTLVTQNIDSLHQRAGSREVVELHGNIARVKCSLEQIIVSDFSGDESPPRCHCGAYLRPDVVWFGEMLPADALARAEDAAEHCEVFLSIGTSAQVYPAAELPLRALSAGATVVETTRNGRHCRATPLPLQGRRNSAATAIVSRSGNDRK
jgi:NAD-dependent deacetylase